MSDTEIEKIVSDKINELNIKDQSQMGLLMKNLMVELKGKAGGEKVKNAVMKLLK